jgi:hypothetical protein
VWLILFGFYISRNHYRKEVTGPRFKFRGKLPAQQSTLRWALGKPGRAARRTAPASAQASAKSAGQHAVTGANPPESPAEDSMPAALLQLAERVGALEREAGHCHQAQEALSSVHELSQQVNRLAARLPARRPADESGYRENR